MKAKRSDLTYKTGLLLSLFLLMLTAPLQGTAQTKEKINIVWLPVIASSPANGLMLGVAPAANWIMGDPENTSISSVLSSFIYTTQNQFLFTFKGTEFFDNDDFMIMQDWRFFVTSQPTFGLGTGPQSNRLVSSGIEYEDGLYSQKIDQAQFMKFNFLRMHQTFLRRLGTSRMYTGFGYHLDYHFKIDDQLLDMETVPPAITSHYAYSEKHGIPAEKYWLSGLSGNFILDNRDNTINPYKGNYLFLSFKYNPTWLGSTKNSTSLWTEYRDYFSLSQKRNRNILAWWFYGNFQMSGDLPYMDLPSQGWDQFGRSGRAYPQGRFRGESIIYNELEWRFPLQRNKEKWGGVVFANATSTTNKAADINMFDYLNIGYGAGIRWMVNEKSRTNICFDFGFGDYGAKGFYLSVNEVF